MNQLIQLYDTPILIASFHNGNIDERVLAAQQRVFHAIRENA